MASFSGAQLNWAALALLLNAPSKRAALKCFNRAFVHRNTPAEMPTAAIAAEFSITESQAGELAAVLVQIVKAALYESSAAAALRAVDAHAAGLDARLRGLVEQVVSAQLAEWRDAAVRSRPALPRYVGADWRVDVKAASGGVSQMHVPSLLVDLKVQNQPDATNRVPSARHVEFELSQEALLTMLDGLGRIRDQLGAVAASN